MNAVKTITSDDWVLHDLMQRPLKVLSGIDGRATRHLKRELKINTIRGFFLQLLKDEAALHAVKFVVPRSTKRAATHIASVATGSSEDAVHTQWWAEQRRAFKRGQTVPVRLGQVPTKRAAQKLPFKEAEPPPPGHDVWTEQIQRAEAHQKKLMTDLGQAKRKATRLQDGLVEAGKKGDVVSKRHRRLKKQHDQTQKTLQDLTSKRDGLASELASLVGERDRLQQILSRASTPPEVDTPSSPEAHEAARFTLYLDCAPTGPTTSLTALLRLAQREAFTKGSGQALLERLREDREEAYAHMALELVRRGSIPPGARLTADRSQRSMGLAIEVLASLATVVIEAH